MPTYKLVYFDGRGRAELPRMLFAEAGVKYEDFRVKENWASEKPKTPFGKLPVLTVDGGEPLAESGAIVRYLAREFDLDGGSSIHAAQADMIHTAVIDLSNDFPYFEEDKAKLAERVKTLEEKKANLVFEKIEERLKASGSQFLVARKLTYADIAVASFVDAFKDFDDSFIKKFPCLDALQQRIASRPNIKKWFDNRPKTMF
ncbi:glutathione S-transferase 1-like [Clavelina lepadiformis]|uniref:glutathione S-transferase 1-like n=1 Tax=Clavelina lepadiformis TaxID=159417 RepID=UPI004043103C